MQLNEIVKENARLVIERIELEARLEGSSKTELVSEIARQMFKHMGREGGDPGATLRGLKSERSKQLWRTDYIEGFCAATGIKPEELVSARLGIKLRSRIESLERQVERQAAKATRPKGMRSGSKSTKRAKAG